MDVPPLPEGAWPGCGTGFGTYRDMLRERLGPGLGAIAPAVLPRASVMLTMARAAMRAGAMLDPSLAAPRYLRNRVALTRAERESAPRWPPEAPHDASRRQRRADRHRRDRYSGCSGCNGCTRAGHRIAARAGAHERIRLIGVTAVEREIYEFPWTLANFRDSITAGYDCWIYLGTSTALRPFIGYSIVMFTPGEAHLLNLSVAAPLQRQGHGARMLAHVLALARQPEVERLLLEVRPSNMVARHLYERNGFVSIGRRPNYYPARDGREDAIILARTL